MLTPRCCLREPVCGIGPCCKPLERQVCRGRTFRTVSRGPVRNPNQPLSFLVMVWAAASVADCTAAPAEAAALVAPSPRVAAAVSAKVIMDTVSFAARWSEADGALYNTHESHHTKQC